jgi:hypothetical protein
MTSYFSFIIVLLVGALSTALEVRHRQIVVSQSLVEKAPPALRSPSSAVRGDGDLAPITLRYGFALGGPAAMEQTEDCT